MGFLWRRNVVLTLASRFWTAVLTEAVFVSRFTSLCSDVVLLNFLPLTSPMRLRIGTMCYKSIITLCKSSKGLANTLHLKLFEKRWPNGLNTAATSKFSPRQSFKLPDRILWVSLSANIQIFTLHSDEGRQPCVVRSGVSALDSVQFSSGTRFNKCFILTSFCLRLRLCLCRLYVNSSVFSSARIA